MCAEGVRLGAGGTGGVNSFLDRLEQQQAVKDVAESTEPAPAKQEEIGDDVAMTEASTGTPAEAPAEEAAEAAVDPNAEVVGEIELDEATEGKVKALEEMGFPRNRCIKGLAKTGWEDVQAAMEWVFAHMDDPDIDAPLTVGDLQQKQKSKLSKEEQKKVLEDRIQQRRKERTEDEKQRDLEREINRRRQGKEAQEAKRKHEEQKAKKIAEEQRREKEEERKAREAIRAKIAQDKAEREAKKKGQQAPAAATKPAAAAAPPSKREYNETKVQFRLMAGGVTTNVFPATATIGDLYSWVESNANPGEPFVLMTTFPRAYFTPDKHGMTLKEADLVPSATVVITRP